MVSFSLIGIPALFLPALKVKEVNDALIQLSGRVDIDSFIVIPGNDSMDEDEDGAVVIPLSDDKATNTVMHLLFMENGNASNHDESLAGFQDPDFPVAKVAGASYREVRKAIGAVKGAHVARDDAGGVYVGIASEEAADAMSELSHRVSRIKKPNRWNPHANG